MKIPVPLPIITRIQIIVLYEQGVSTYLNAVLSEMFGRTCFDFVRHVFKSGNLHR